MGSTVKKAKVTNIDGDLNICLTRSKENNSQMNFFFFNTACFYTGDGLGPEVIYRAKEKALFRKKAPSFIPRVGFALRLPRKTISTLLK